MPVERTLVIKDRCHCAGRDATVLGEMPLCWERCHCAGRDATVLGEMPLCWERCHALEINCEFKKQANKN